MTTSTGSDANVDTVLAEIFFTAAGKADPYPGFATVRESAALHDTALGVSVVARYEDCQAVLRDNRLGRGTQRNRELLGVGVDRDAFNARFPRFGKGAQSMLGLDPPDHTRHRSLVAKAFTPKMIEGLRPHIQRLTDELLDPLAGDVDVMSELALKLPVTVIGEMLGVPAEDHAALLGPIRTVIRLLATFGADLDEFEDIYIASAVLDDYFRNLAADKRAHPGTDVLTELVHAEEQGDQLSEAELLATIRLLFAAGYETTTNLIGNGLYALLRFPAELQRLRDDPSLLKSAIEEMLRYDSPIPMTARTVLEGEVEIAGQPVPPGTVVLTLLGAANRDPRVYDDPDRFDIGRVGPAPLSFAAGVHYCLGAALARAEGQVLFNTLLDRYAIIEPAWADDNPPTYRDNFFLRGLETLPVRLHPR